MYLSKIKDKAILFLQEILDHFENVKLKEFVIMPNYVHCIIEIFLKDSSGKSDIATKEKIPWRDATDELPARILAQYN